MVKIIQELFYSFNIISFIKMEKLKVSETQSILSKANVTNLGAVLLGKHVACDAYDEARPIRVVTHAHSDHMVGLGKSLKTCEVTVMTPATMDLISALKGPRFLSRGIVKTLDYGEALIYGDEKLTLHYADHILGTAQALVEDNEQTRIYILAILNFQELH